MYSGILFSYLIYPKIYNFEKYLASVHVCYVSILFLIFCEFSVSLQKILLCVYLTFIALALLYMACNDIQFHVFFFSISCVQKRICVFHFDQNGCLHEFNNVNTFMFILLFTTYICNIRRILKFLIAPKRNSNDKKMNNPKEQFN